MSHYIRLRQSRTCLLLLMLSRLRRVRRIDLGDARTDIAFHLREAVEEDALVELGIGVEFAEEELLVRPIAVVERGGAGNFPAVPVDGAEGPGKNVAMRHDQNFCAPPIV